MKKSNVRHLTTALAASSFLVASPSYALGIGDMKLQSALNQNLQAEIALILSNDEKTSDFKVGLAPNAKFDEAGIPWTLFLSKIKFQTVSQNGKTFIRLTSTEVLKEPFLDFLLEVKSAKGSLYREFTVLVDPPTAYHVANETLPPPVQTPAELPQRFVFAPSEITAEESDYGPTRQNETLWSIAAQFNKQNNVSIERMLAAIYIANPDAFASKKTDSLIAGKILKIPTFAKDPLLFAETEQEHHAAAKPARQKPVHVAKPPRHEKPAKSELVTVEPAAMQQKMTELEKQLAAMKKTIAEKDAQIVASKPSSTTSKSEAVVTPEPITKPVPVTPPPITTNPIAPVTATVTPVAPVVQAVLPPVSEPAAISQAAAPVFETPAQPIAVLPPPTLPVIATPPVTVPPVTPVPAPVPPVTPTPVVSTTGNYFGISTDLYYYVAGGVGSLLLGLLALLRLRERNKTTDIADETAKPAEEIETAENTVDTTINNSETIDNSTNAMFDDNFDMDNMEFEDFAATTFSNFANHEEDNRVDDILYKADVYCAYGNSEQAEKLLHDEFVKNPQAHEYALRLLKLYEAEDNKIEFKNFVLELVKLGKNDLPDFWVQVSDIAAAFYPEALFFTPPPAIPNPLTSIPFDEMFASVNLDEKFDDSIDFDSMSFDDADDKEITFGELLPEETLSSADVTDLFEKPAAIPIAATSMDQMFANEMSNQKPTNGLDFSSMGFDDPDDKEITFGELSPEETLSSANMTDFFSEVPDNTPITFEFDKISITEKEEPILDFGGFEMNESLETKPTDITTEDFALDFSAFAVDSQPETPADEVSLDFSAFAVDNQPETPADEVSLDFSAFAVDNQPETPADEVSLDFSAFAVDSQPETPADEVSLDFSAFAVDSQPETPADEVSLDFSAFAVDSQPETPADEVSLDFSAFAVDSQPETPADEISLDFSAFAVDNQPETPADEVSLDFSAFAVNEPLTNGTTFGFTEDSSETKSIPEPELVMVDFPFEKQDAATFKQSFTFEKANDLVEENGMRTYLDLTKMPENEEEHLEYLDMSDSQFAELLVAEMLQKHKIKERLCRQKIVQEVLDKLR